MARRVKRAGAARRMPRWLRQQIDREFVGLARYFAVSGSRLSEEFTQFYPADARLAPLHEALVVMLDLDRRGGYYAGAALMHTARNNLEISRLFADRFRDLWARRKQADLAFCKIVDDLGKRYPELMESFALDGDWLADLRSDARRRPRSSWIDRTIQSMFDA